ncbi:MAG TPA: hypothetical protein VN456_12240 [Desulfosporosinus sp.]|nr:hypothetical protein [Desulfosporosinus sp.]
MISDFEQRVKEYWAGTPAIVVVKEIKRRLELPKWEDCPKDHIYVGIQRGKRGDKVTMVKHKMEMVLTTKKCVVEDLTPKEHYFLGVVPPFASMICVQCGEFSTRINIGRICQDCTDLAKGGGKS